MRRACVLFVLCALAVCNRVSGRKFPHRDKQITKHAKWEEAKDEKRDVVPGSYDYSYAGQPAASYSPSTYTGSEVTGTQKSAMPAAYPSAAPASYPSQAAASPAASPAAYPAASPSTAGSATARSRPAAAPAPASAPSPSPAPAAYASHPSQAPSPAPAPAPAAYTAAAAPVAADARSAFPASSPAPAPAPAYNPSTYKGTSVSSSYVVNPPAPAYYSYPYPAPAPAPAAAPAAPAPKPIELNPKLSATAQIAAFVAEIAKSTSGKGRSNIHVNESMCADDDRAENFCRKAYNPCFCEENHHFMYNYCKRSCTWCDSSEKVGHKFWRIVNSAKLPRSWTISEVKFYSDKSSKVPLQTDPSKAYASSSYMGYLPSNAFDGKDSTYWLPDGWYEREPGMDYLGFQFATPVAINSIEVIHQNQTSVTSKKMMIEASDFYDGPYSPKWIIENPQGQQDMRFSNRMCPLFWRRFATDEGTYCFRQMTEMVTWHEARDRCAKYGADLTSITGPEESSFLRNEVQPCGYTWIGMNDIKNESNFEWSDGKKITFRQFATEEEYMAQDDRLNELQDCIAMARTGEWHNFNCDDKFYFICKLKLRPTEYHEPAAANNLKKLHKLKAKLGRTHNKTPRPAEEEDETSGGSFEEEDEDNTEDALHENHESKSKESESNIEDELDASSASGSASHSDSSNPEKSGDDRDEIQKVWEF